MKRRGGYIFTNKRNSDRAILSTVLGVIAVMSLLAVIYLTYVQRGEAARSYGLTGLLAMIMSLVGLVLAILSVLDRDCYKLFPVLGLVFNGLALAGVGLVIYAGIFI